jgi:hypothetical protein
MNSLGSWVGNQNKYDAQSDLAFVCVQHVTSLTKLVVAWQLNASREEMWILVDSKGFLTVVYNTQNYGFLDFVHRSRN